MRQWLFWGLERLVVDLCRLSRAPFSGVAEAIFDYTLGGIGSQ